MSARPELKLLAGAYACLGVIVLTGCISSPDRAGAMHFATPGARNAQLALTGLMAVDTAQTVTIGRSPDCLHEANPAAAAVFGTEYPSPQRVLVTNAIYMTGHWALGSYLDRRANEPVDLSTDAQTDIARKSRWRVLQRVYQLLTGVGHGVAVTRNAAMGIAPFSIFKCGSQP